MTITVAYERKDFFGNRLYTEDIKEAACLDDLLKALKHLKKGILDAVKTENDSIYYDSIEDRENDVLTICSGPAWNDKTFSKISYSALVKRFKRA